MNSLNTFEIANILNTKIKYIQLKTKKAKDNNQNCIIIRDKTYYFRKKLVGKGYEYCEVSFNEVLNSVETSLNGSLSGVKSENVSDTNILKTNNKDLIIVHQPVNVYNTKDEMTLSKLADIDKTKIDLKLSLIKDWKHNKFQATEYKLKFDDFILHNFLTYETIV